MNNNIDWFTSLHSNQDLANILYDYSQDVNGQATWLPRAGRCTLVNHLENLDRQVEQMPRHRLAEQGWN
jgi:hypothetical protein